ncbi:hypothetical protein [Nocardioides abyssi]|uniref:PknH-like extracellular domain-containing protein n=1 Tax=Nocardioides abyssi TaxID=3058370 RepID=A0ABT8ESG9_9ACTN|nr:hypothetical protein [Nocardioides abyssi]MDN4161112.1 hypothetical protein [Nocardioides abyssi]
MKDVEGFMRDLSDGTLTKAPLCPEVVRRRGDRMRRRRSIAGAMAVVAVTAASVGTPYAIVSSQSDADLPTVSSAPPGPDQRSTRWKDEIPASFPLTDGMPVTNGHDGSPVRVVRGYEAQVPGPCGQEPWDPDVPVEAVDIASAVYTGETEGGEQRTLALYASDDDARRVVQTTRVDVSACFGSTGAIQATELPGNRAAEGSIRYLNRWRDGDGFTGEGHLNEVSRAGNAVLFTSVYIAGAGGPEVVEAELLRQQYATQGPIAALCAFAEEPCA